MERPPMCTVHGRTRSPASNTACRDCVLRNEGGARNHVRCARRTTRVDAPLHIDRRLCRHANDHGMTPRNLNAGRRQHASGSGSLHMARAALHAR